VVHRAGLGDLEKKKISRHNRIRSPDGPVRSLVADSSKTDHYASSP